MSAQPLILTELADGIAVVTLNEPERRNPMSPALIAQLTHTLRELADDDECNAVVLRGAGRGFCAGADMSRMAETTITQDRIEYNAILDLNHLLWGYPKPTVAAVHGFALGGGCSLMNWCDFSVVEESTRMGFPEVVSGLPSSTVVPTPSRTASGSLGAVRSGACPNPGGRCLVSTTPVSQTMTARSIVLRNSRTLPGHE